MRYEPGSRLDRFEILDSLGEGAYAETYTARDTSTGDVVVLKSPNPMLFADPAVHQRFQREREIARTLDHPGVQRSAGTDEDAKAPYLVLEYVKGDNFRSHLRGIDGATVPVATALGWGRELASILAYLHEHGIVHRDLKPENLVINPDGHLKLLDFGTALLDGAKRLTWKHLTDSVGTPDYMSPEQIRGERGDQRSDIYAWGTMMYELLTGAVPFSGDNWMAAMAAHLSKTPDPIRKKNHDVSPALEAVVLKSMRRYPENRYQNAGDLLADLDRLDQLDAASFDLSPEPPMGGMAMADTPQKIWLLILVIALSFITVVAVVITLSVVL